MSIGATPIFIRKAPRRASDVRRTTRTGRRREFLPCRGAGWNEKHVRTKRRPGDRELN